MGSSPAVAPSRPTPIWRAEVGDAPAVDFDEFFGAEQRSLLRYCWGLTVDADAAADVAQEAMTRALRDWSTVGAAGSNPAAWVRTVALNLVRSQWRRTGTAAAAAHLTAVRLDDSPPEADGAVRLDLDRALRALPERQREAIALHHLCDLAVEEVARIMGVGASTVKVHLQRGRAALAAALEEA